MNGETKLVDMPLKHLLLLLVFAIKPIADMFWQLQAIDILMLSLVALLLVVGAAKSSVRYETIDIVAVLLMVSILFSFIRGGSGIAILVKMESAFLLYFCGRIYYLQSSMVLRTLLISYAIVILVNFIIMLTGSGYQYWGNAYTFSGLYYFKTDLASAATMAFTLFLYWGNRKALRIAMLASSTVLVVLSNTRAYYVALLLVVLVYVIYLRGGRINLGMILAVSLGSIVALYFLNWLFSTGIFSGAGFIGFRFDKLSDLLDDSNTQGRNVIWAELARRMADSGLMSQLFGIDLVSDMVTVYGETYGAHSLYVGLLFNIGVLGILQFAIFELIALARLSELREGLRDASFFVFSLSLTFLVAGLSVHTLQYTSVSWLPMYFVGSTVSSCGSTQ